MHRGWRYEVVPIAKVVDAVFCICGWSKGMRVGEVEGIGIGEEVGD